ncbi:tRNA pseudouridine(38-40) synthase TruA [Salinibius halmophilus]|uniref:tRNA pseudouridine(38-40) synthase TruA n=1 Tax=Salinibius halmophilus TaxID=1853216 RepID=UPI000E663503|nr:tRNA pseudouridine(38-40) synthase TruA [Salinibius halmophilus]
MTEEFRPDAPDKIHRYALGVEYDGQAFYGFQLQTNAFPTVQGVLETAVGKIANEAVRFSCAGRTDTGVSASVQVVHFDTSVERPIHSWILGSNRHLPDGCSIQWAKKMPASFHARFSAQARRYRYCIVNRDYPHAINRRGLAWYRHPLDVEKMHAAAQLLVGEHDFSSFRAAHCQAHSPVKNLHFIRVERYGDMVTIDVKANAFLYHMVRNIAGSLMQIGAGDYPVDWLAEVFAKRDRRQAGITAPPEGLTFTGVDYDKKFELPCTYREPVFLSWIDHANQN